MIFRGLKFQRIDEEEEAWWLMLERQERVVMLSAAVGKGRLGDTQTQSASSEDLRNPLHRMSRLRLNLSSKPVSYSIKILCMFNAVALLTRPLPSVFDHTLQPPPSRSLHQSCSTQLI